MYRYLLVMVLFMQLNVYAQIDQKKLDSLARSIDSSAKANKSWQDSFTNAQDSIYRSAIKTNPANNNIAEQEKEKIKQRQQIMLRIVISVVLLIAIIVLLLRRRNTKT